MAKIEIALGTSSPTSGDVPRRNPASGRGLVREKTTTHFSRTLTRGAVRSAPRRVSRPATDARLSPRSPSLRAGAPRPTERWLPRRAATRATLALPVAHAGSISTHRALAASQSGGDARHPRPPRRSHREHLHLHRALPACHPRSRRHCASPRRSHRERLDPPRAACVPLSFSATRLLFPDALPVSCKGTSRTEEPTTRLATRGISRSPRVKSRGDSNRSNSFVIVVRVTKLARLEGPF